MQKFVYVIGPAADLTNYNVPDTSYLSYTLETNQQLTSNLDTIKKKITDKLKKNKWSLRPEDYIAPVKLTADKQFKYYYGRSIDLSSDTFDNILDKYINAYDSSVAIDNVVEGETGDTIKVIDLSKFGSASVKALDADDYDVILQNGEDVVRFDVSTGAFVFDVANIESYIKDAGDGRNELFDWCGNVIDIKNVKEQFMTVEQANKLYPGVNSDMKNNYVLLRSVKEKWRGTWYNDHNGAPSMVKTDFGARSPFKLVEPTIKGKLDFTNIYNNYLKHGHIE